MEQIQETEKKPHRDHYNIRCEFPGCKILAKKKPASDGKHYCKRHNPDKVEEEKIPDVLPPRQPLTQEKQPMEQTEDKPIGHYERKHQEFIENHLNKIHIDGVDTEKYAPSHPIIEEVKEEFDDNDEPEGENNMEIPKFIKPKEEPAPQPPVQPQVQPKEEATLSLKMSLTELQLDYLAHSFLIDAIYKSYSTIGLPNHIAQLEIERLVAPHRARLNDISAVLEQFNATN